MLNTQKSIILSEYTGLYDIVVPADHMLRKFKESVDLSFVYQELEGKYSAGMGRTAEDPVRMFKYLLLKYIFDMSDRGLVHRAMSDMAFKYFLDLAPEAPVIDSSLLSKFRKQRLADVDLLDTLISRSVSLAVEMGVIKSRTLIIDATHTCSKYNPVAPVELLRLRSKRLRKSVYSLTVEPETYKAGFPAKNTTDDVAAEIDYSRALIAAVRKDAPMAEQPAVEEAINLLEETIGDIEDHFTTSADPDARIGHKSADSDFLGYKTHIAMTSEGIITAATITSGEKPDGKQLGTLVEKSRANLGADESDKKVDEVLADGTYSGDENLKLAEDPELGFSLVSKTNPMLHKGNDRKDDGFELNKDAGMYTCPAGHLAVKKRIVRYSNKGGRNKGNDRIQFTFPADKCSACKLRGQCLKGKARRRTYSIPIRSPQQTRQMEFEKTAHFRARARQRYRIEAKNAELKNIYGYGITDSYGLESMRLQGAVTLFVANIARIAKLAAK